MKKQTIKSVFYTVCACLSAAAAVSVLAACSAPEWPSSLAVEPGSTREVSQISYSALTLAPVSTTLSSSYMRGIDASEVKALEENGTVFYDENNAQCDVFKILSDSGVNWIRLRLWNDYTKAAEGDWGPYGYNNLSRTIDMARRAKKYGMKVLLDFHYSDNWADPAKQKIPDMWKDIATVEALTAAVADWTEDILLKMKTAGCAPEMVQLGNEMEVGIFVTGSAITTLTTANRASILNAAAAKVRSTLPETKIMLHMSRGGNSGVLSSFYTNYVSHVVCDVVGLSYYPYFSSHGTLTALQANINTIVTTYGKQAVIAEISYGYSTSAYTDTTSNSFWTTQEVQSATQINTNDGLKTVNTDGDTVIAASIEMQARVIREVIEKTALSGASGLFYWGACYLGIDEVMPSSWENQALFDINGKALPSLKVMGIQGN